MNWSETVFWIFHMPCLFHLLTGLYCPGCGGTRAVKYFLQGKWGQSFIYHPLILYGAAALVAEGLSVLAALVRGTSLPHPGKNLRLVYGGVALVIINWIVKNGALVFLGIDLLAEPL